MLLAMLRCMPLLHVQIPLDMILKAFRAYSWTPEWAHRTCR